jgi:hypothetical protein
MGKIVWTDRVRNEEVSQRGGVEEHHIRTYSKKKGALTGLVVSCVGTAL